MNSGLSPELNRDSVMPPGSQKVRVFSSVFTTIPPERVGLTGEYDHNGLAKRVALAFHQEFQLEDIASLKIRQRGGVVILMGKVASQRILTRLIHTALQVSGATDVETYGITLEPNRESLTQPDYLKPRLHAC